MTPHPLATWLQMKNTPDRSRSRRRRTDEPASRRSGPRTRFGRSPDIS